ncbi:nucleotidyltransferase [Candidatus Berkelbacteria bacterium CG10_big_fil_rev_8_21_14_0_10_43_13]|uniref:Nucleotidyltransferase n=1 Tax=Candidatus Berkelbacteria bacterium CG10_big_fil_rev_8_21_14_0_10_43_13 TaxID=1974514 RepID=A0A2H0W9H2_9BACT|nr:MAG: nucleotidyltransferase [Candidatus Berkelbacteria bacterium CG10_big_fil_rev_8_21_14_0_10_43_13]
MSTTEAKQIGKRYAQHLRQNHFPFKQIYLFGSFAKGSFDEESDIDIAVISDKFDEVDVKKWFQNRFKLGKLRFDVDLRIEPHGLSPKEFEDEDSIMTYEIKKHGIKIA